MRRRRPIVRLPLLLKLSLGCVFGSLIAMCSMAAKKIKPDLPFETWHGALAFVLLLVLAYVFYWARKNQLKKQATPAAVSSRFLV